MKYSLMLVAAALCAAAPAPAQAVTVEGGFVDPGLYGVPYTWVNVTAAGGEANTVTMESSGARDAVTVRDTTAPVTASGKCTQMDEHTASCEVESTGVQAVVRAGDADDSVAVGQGFASVYVDGGAGADVLRGGPAGDILLGGPGPDDVDGGPGSDELREGASEHEPVTLEPDTLSGGAGIDTLSYAGRRGPVHIDLAAGMSGAKGEGDVPSGIENVIGGDAADELYGSAEPNVITYGPGDTASGRGGDDVIKVWGGVTFRPAVRCGTGIDIVNFLEPGPRRPTLVMAHGCERLSVSVDDSNRGETYIPTIARLDLRARSRSPSRLYFEVEGRPPGSAGLYLPNHKPTTNMKLGVWRRPHDDIGHAPRTSEVAVRLTKRGRRKLSPGRHAVRILFRWAAYGTHPQDGPRVRAWVTVPG